MASRGCQAHAILQRPGQWLLWNAGAHTDWGMLTVLATDAQPGLQISHEGGWIDVEPRPGHFVINIGDLLDRWASAGLWIDDHSWKLPRERMRFCIFGSWHHSSMLRKVETDMSKVLQQITWWISSQVEAWSKKAFLASFACNHWVKHVSGFFQQLRR